MAAGAGVDYEKLAAEFGGKVEPDYESLVKEFGGQIVDAPKPLPPVAAPSLTPRGPAPAAPVMQSAVDPFAPKQDWLPTAPKPPRPLPPSTLAAPEDAIQPAPPGKIPQTIETSPVGQTNAPVPGRIPGMDRLGGVAPGVQAPTNPIQPSIPITKTQPVQQIFKPGPYLTNLSPAEEKMFQQWVAKNNVPFDPTPQADYDMRGFWKAMVSGDPRATSGISPSDNQIHYPDTWKTPNHETFSNESIYAGPGAPHWEGDKLVDSRGRVIKDETPPAPTNAPIQGFIPGMDRLGGAAPGVPIPPMAMGSPAPALLPPPRRVQNVQIQANEIPPPPAAVISTAKSGPVPQVAEGPAQTFSEGLGQAVDYTAQQVPKLASAIGVSASGVPLTDEELNQVGDTANQPLVKPSLMIPDDHRPDATRELIRGAVEGVEGLTTPETLAVIASTGGIGRAAQAAASPAVRGALKGATTALSLYFTGQAGKGAYEAGKTAYELHQKGDDEGAARYLGLASVDALFAVLGVAHAASEAVGGAKSFKEGYERGQRRREAVDADAEARFEAAQKKLQAEAFEEIPGEPGKFRIKQNRGEASPSPESPQQAVEVAPQEAKPAPIEGKGLNENQPQNQQVAPPVAPIQPVQEEKPAVPQTGREEQREDAREISEDAREIASSPLGAQPAPAQQPEPNLSQEPALVPAPGPREEVVQPKPAEAAAPVAEGMPEQGFRNMAQRMVNARTSMEENIAELGGVTKEQAADYLDKLIDAKAVNMDPVNSVYRVKHGALLDRDVIRKNLGLSEQDPNAPISPEAPPSPGAVEAAAPAPVDRNEPPAPAAVGENGRTLDPDTFRVPTSSLSVDPQRFQYKIEGIGQGGVNEELKASKKWNPALAGVISVWRDPADGKDYVVNGHHRFELASRLGVPSLKVAYIDAPDAKAARAAGALMNIAEGRGTSIDAAKFMRDTDMSAEEIEQNGISLKGEKAREGAALANLAPSLFDEVVHGGLPLKRAVIIGENLPNQADQMGAMALLRDYERRGKRPTDAEVKELIRRTAQAERKVEQQDTLFGVQEMTQNLALEEAQLSNFVRSRLGNEKKLFSTVGSQAAADRLGAAGNKIDAEANKQVAQQADQALAVYDKLSLSAGPISDALREGARRIANGEKLDAVKEGVYAAVRDSVSRLLRADAKPAADAGVREADAGAEASGNPRAEEGDGQRQPATGEGRAGNTVERTKDGLQETLVTDREARESQIAAKNDRNRPLAEVPFSLYSPEAPAPTGPDERQSSMFGDGEVVGYAPGKSAAFRPGTPSKAPAKPTKSPGGKKGQMTSRSEIVRDLSSFLNDIPIRVGGIKERAAGIFKTRQNVIRTQKALDLPTIAHEIGHAIHKYLWRTDPKNINRLNSLPLRPFKKELGPLDYDQKQQRPLEGFAEYIRLRLTEPGEAQRRAPHFHAWFNKHIEGHPDLVDVLNKAEERIGQWYKQSGTEKIAASIQKKAPERKRWASWADRQVVQNFDDLHLVRKIEEEMDEAGVPPQGAASAYEFMRMLSSSAQKAEYMIRRNTFIDSDTDPKLGASMAEIVKPLANRKPSDYNPRWKRYAENNGVVIKGDGLDDLRVYMSARRFKGYHENGLETGFTDDELNEAIRSTETPAVKKAAEGLSDFSWRVIDYAVDKEAITKQQRDSMRSNGEFYAPIWRIMGDESQQSSGNKSSRNLLHTDSPIRKRKGSVREWTDPLENFIHNTHAIVSFADRFEAQATLAKRIAMAQDMGLVLESGISPKMVKTTFNLEELRPAIAKAMEAEGFDISDVDLDVAASIYRMAHRPNAKNGEVLLPDVEIVDGKPVTNGKMATYYMDRDLAESLSFRNTMWNYEAYRAAAVIADALRLGATGIGPDFVARNPLRDTVEAAMNSDNGFRPVVDTILGSLEILRKPEMVDEMIRGGYGGSFQTPQRDNSGPHFDRLLMNPVRYVMRHPMEVFSVIVDALKLAGEHTELATRAGEYRLAKKAGVPYKNRVMASRDVSVDFSMMGLIGRIMNPISAYFSATMNGNYRAYRNLFNKKTRWRTIRRGIQYFTIPTLALWLMNKDDPEFEELPDYQKTFFWNIPTKYMPQRIRDVMGPFITIPRAHIYGLIFGSLPERAFDAAYKKNPEKFSSSAKAFLADTMGTVIPNIIPNVILTPVELMTNWTFFRAQQIESKRDQDFPVEFRSHSNTTWTAKKIAAGLNAMGMPISPLKVEHAIYSLSASAGRATLTGAEALFTKKLNKVAPEAADIPVFRAFATHAVPNSPASIRRLYDRLGELTEIAKAANDAKKNPHGRAAGAREMTDEEKNELRKLMTAARGKKNKNSLAALNQRIHNTEYDEKLTPEEKKREIIRLKKIRVNVAREAIGLPAAYKID